MVATARDGQTEHRPIDVSGIREKKDLGRIKKDGVRSPRYVRQGYDGRDGLHEIRW